MKAELKLREYISFDDVNGNETVSMLPLTIIDAMEEYAEHYLKQWLKENMPSEAYKKCLEDIPLEIQKKVIKSAHLIDERINFAIWYSGIEKEKVVAAYHRYLDEKPH